MREVVSASVIVCGRCYRVTAWGHDHHGGRDVIGVAKTGSGKTIAFLLPLFRHIKDQRPLENMEGAMAIVMTPTRELALQIHRECKPFLKALGLRVSCSSHFCIEKFQTKHVP